MSASGTGIEIRPLTPERFPDLERLFRRPGDPSGCWCMWWRMVPKEFSAARVAERHELLRARAADAPAPGLLAYDGGEAVGWVAVAPRAEHERIPRSTVITYEEVPDCWSVTCFFVHPAHRSRGLMPAMLDAAVDHARAHGARTVEAYPVEAVEGQSDSGLFRGAMSVFLRAGFTEVGRRRNRPTVRLALNDAG